MSAHHRLVVVPVLLLAAAAWPATAGRSAPEVGVSASSATRLQAHVEFLADDLLEGREAGTRGYDLAALYVATELQLWGLEPAGDEGSFFQQVPLRETTLEDAGVELMLDGEPPVTLAVPDEVVVGAGTAGGERSVSAPVVFAGFGIHAPELQHDDYAGLDVAGKLVLVMTNAPASFPSEPRAHFASTRLKAQVAADRGAVGLVQMFGPEERARYPWARVTALADEPEVTWVREDGTAGRGDPRLQATALLSSEIAERLFAAAGVELADVLAEARTGAPSPRPLPARLAIRTRSRVEPMASANVAARLPGADPVLADTSVVLTAHLDHTGLGEPVNGDPIYNGAYDNAMGSAILLEMARAFTASPEPPRRSLLFVFVTAEEKGLVGSDYFAQHPPAAAGQMVAAVNLDMPLFLTASSDLVAFGSENSTLDTVVRDAAAREGLTLSPDPLPQENLFVRSDQYSFVRQGVPSVYLMPGFTAADASVNGGELVSSFLKRHYHRPSDDLSRPMDFEAAVRFTRANYHIAAAIANNALAPEWKPGNFFGKTFGRK